MALCVYVCMSVSVSVCCLDTLWYSDLSNKAERQDGPTILFSFVAFVCLQHVSIHLQYVSGIKQQCGGVHQHWYFIALVMVIFLGTYSCYDLVKGSA